jgi:mRNA-degrading endonuclease toxin of MazEF toxin-antitoxin module
LVISPDYRNERASDVIIVPCTTVLREAPTHVALRKGEAGAPARSLLKCEQITTLAKSDVLGQPLGSRLSSRKLVEVERGILRAIGIPMPEVD